MTDKAALRRQVRALYPGGAERDRQSALLCAHILDSAWYREAQVIGGYIPMAREADVTAVLNAALAQGKTLALPLCGIAPHMTFRRVRTLEELLPGAFGIPEPGEDTELIGADEISLLLTPLEAIDLRGMRLGKGGGYYDCLLAGHDVRTMGCALSWQQVERVPADAWDRRLQACADQHGIRYFDKA